MFKTVMRGVCMAALLALTMGLGVARASPAQDARAHFQAIAAGDMPSLMAGYADGARLSWVGGPLDGDYAGAQAIRAVWTKFTGAQGALTFDVDALNASANPQGATVTANVQFVGKAAIQVRYVLTYRAGKIVSEIWQIDPNLTVSAAS